MKKKIDVEKVLNKDCFVKRYNITKCIRRVITRKVHKNEKKGEKFV